MKKLTTVTLTLGLGLLLAGCQTNDLAFKVKELEQQISELDEKEEENKSEIEELKSTINTLTENQSPTLQMEIGESLAFSGTLVMGFDLAPGSYDITIPQGSDSASFDLFENDTARENNDYEFVYLAKDSEDAAIPVEIKNYSLKRGYILEISNSINLTRIK